MTFLEGMPGILCIRAAVYRAQGMDQRARETAQVLPTSEKQNTKTDFTLSRSPVQASLMWECCHLLAQQDYM